MTQTPAAEKPAMTSEAIATAKAEVDKIIKELSSQVDYSRIDLKRNYGTARIAVIADAAGKILEETGPFGNLQPAFLMVDGTWQMADGIKGKLSAIPGAAKFFVWRWDSARGEYIPDRTPYDKDGKPGNEGAFEQYVRRHHSKSPIISLPGAAELGYLAKAATEVAKEIKAAKGKTTEAQAERIAMNFAAFFKGAGFDADKTRAIIFKAMPELWAKPTQSAEHKK